MAGKKRGTVDPAKLPPEDLAGILSKGGGEPVTKSQVTRDLEAGAPTNDDGTIHLVHYTAWLVTQVK